MGFRSAVSSMVDCILRRKKQRTAAIEKQFVAFQQLLHKLQRACMAADMDVQKQQEVVRRRMDDMRAQHGTSGAARAKAAGAAAYTELAKKEAVAKRCKQELAIRSSEHDNLRVAHDLASAETNGSPWTVLTKMLPAMDIDKMSNEQEKRQEHLVEVVEQCDDMRDKADAFAQNSVQSEVSFEDAFDSYTQDCDHANEQAMDMLPSPLALTGSRDPASPSVVVSMGSVKLDMS
jgi:hypothetical protein